MHEVYDYVTLRAEGGASTAADVAGRVREAGAVLASHAGTLVGVWQGERGIGFASDEVVTLVGWSDDHVPGAVAVVPPEGAEVVHAERLQATARPASPVPFAPGGIVAHRWFELHDAADADEFVRLSVEAWEGFEAAFQTEPLGLWHDGGTRFLLLTRYSSVAEWERSRGTATAASGPAAEAGRRFARRRAMTRSSAVRLVPFPAS